MIRIDWNLGITCYYQEYKSRYMESGTTRMKGSEVVKASLLRLLG